MNNLDFIARLAKDGLYNPNCEHFGGETVYSYPKVAILPVKFI